MSFHVGQLVVCVDDGNSYREYGVWERPVTRSRIYTVADAHARHSHASRVPCIRLAEVKRLEPFAASRFRPVDENRIEVFRKIAANPKIEVDA